METALARATESVIRAIRPRLSRLMDQVEIHLLAYSERQSEERSRWIAETKAAVADGSMRKHIESQPSPEEIVEQWGRSAAV
ncbi:MAG TPA: hypothetical protein VNU75_13005 [Acidimicrobiales bacterium]|jgi:hypothetical protein|nr:hypothetical protein [Acidimicrobiales bacterium]